MHMYQSHKVEFNQQRLDAVLDTATRRRGLSSLLHFLVACEEAKCILNKVASREINDHLYKCVEKPVEKDEVLRSQVPTVGGGLPNTRLKYKPTSKSSEVNRRCQVPRQPKKVRQRV